MYASYKKPPQIFGDVQCPILCKPSTTLCRLADQHGRKKRPESETVKKVTWQITLASLSSRYVTLGIVECMK